MGRMEIVTVRERRRSWPDEKKLRILQEAARSGLSVADVARRHDSVPQPISIWLRQLLAKVKADAGVHGAPRRSRMVLLQTLGVAELLILGRNAVLYGEDGTARQGTDLD